jgi:hypothetical protein
VPNKIDIKDWALDITITHDTPTGNFDHTLCQELVAALRTLHAAVAMDKFDLKQAGGLTYTYELKALDGRHFDQVLNFDQINNPGMTFDVDDYWHVTEFVAHRALRDVCVKMVGDMLVTEIKVKFL